MRLLLKNTVMGARQAAHAKGIGPYGRKGPIVRIFYLCIALVWWYVSRVRQVSETATVVLCYHGIGEDDLRSFRWQMAWLRGRATDAESIGRSVLGNTRPRGLQVCVTFDDGFACLLSSALPLMRRMSVPATLFAVSGNLGRKPQWQMPARHPETEEMIMSESQLREMVNQGFFRLGSHTVTHPALARLDRRALLVELIESREALERLSGQTVTDLALPYGSGSDEVLLAARVAGYERIFTLEEQIAGNGAQDGAVGRFLMSPDAWRIEFILTCAGAYSWLHPWRRLMRRVRKVFSRGARRYGGNT